MIFEYRAESNKNEEEESYYEDDVNEVVDTSA